MNGRLEVRVSAQNVEASALKMDYRFVWLDRNGVVTEVPTSDWAAISLPAKGTVTLQGQAPSPDAADFLVSVRLAG